MGKGEGKRGQGKGGERRGRKEREEGVEGGGKLPEEKFLLGSIT